MAKSRYLTEEEKAEIRRRIEAGESFLTIGRAIGRGHNTISKFCKREGIRPAHAAPEQMNKVRRWQESERRQDLIEHEMETCRIIGRKLRKAAEQAETAQELLPVTQAHNKNMITLATAIDKLRLELGLPTSYGKQDLVAKHTVTLEELIAHGDGSGRG